ncbi:regulatory protein RecX [Nocardioides marmoribigeumensis]|uniref:Regulatory protein RecX n=1 Tax=Nocardioides marmoribigeumensis TaxID=433649 RepID=A0ABU2BPE6_9ACTN|nr:regulatory protein RecX [Nocardioides marmoribigeumensis]MDR7360500.1 regulatory protein [Nocardioides marmoribigeumensis]
MAGRGRGAGRSRGSRPFTPPPREAPADAEERGPEADHEAVARKILLDQLTGQARSRAELAGKLAKRQVPEEVAGPLLDRFEEVGLVDDASFAREWTQSRHASRGLARRALGVELRRKGVAQDVIDEALEGVSDDSEREAARVLAQRKLRSMSTLDEQTQVRRLVGLLGRKGYSPGLAFAVVREVVGAAQAGDEPDPEDWT